jgi:hypothetical protein
VTGAAIAAAAFLKRIARTAEDDDRRLPCGLEIRSMTTRLLTPMPKGFHGDRFLLRLVDLLAPRAETFLETGSNVGSTLGYVARRFPALECLACEPDPARTP